MSDESTTAEPTIVDKFLLKSRTYWGSAIIAIPIILKWFGVEIPTDLGSIEAAGLAWLDATNEIIGVLVVLYGRYNAPGVRLTVT